MLRLTLLVLTLAASATAGEFHHENFLPPEIPWSGPSEQLMLDPGDAWATDFERSGGTDSPDYAATRAWCDRLVAASDDLRMISLGLSPEQRDIFAIVASHEGAFTPEALHDSERPVVFAHAGIHSGEIDGKDAGMMLLRDMTVGGSKSGLLDRANFVFVPIFSVDAHENRGETSRINQRGPRIQGWRTTARNLNLNRDYTKATAVEMQHMLTMLHTIEPELYLDLHVTDGADYAYDITWGFTGENGWSEATSRWLQTSLRPTVDGLLSEMGHIPGPLIFTVDQTDIRKGMYDWTPSPRFSTGYGNAAHIPTILLENHSLKPYRQRVLGTYVFLEGCLRAVGDDPKGLRKAIHADRASRPDPVHLGYTTGETGETHFLSIRENVQDSEISGAPVANWTGEVEEVVIPVPNNRKRDRFVRRPVAYWIPAAWSDLTDKLELHGIEVERIDHPQSIEVERDFLPEVSIADQPFEGQVRVTPGPAEARVATVEFAPGSARVPLNQPLGTLAMLLLEPGSEDSFFQWGMMLEVLQQSEYFEAYVIEPMARAMMEADPDLAREFQARLDKDEEFAADPRKRLEFFYERTPYFDSRWKLYPIGREF